MMNRLFFLRVFLDMKRRDFLCQAMMASIGVSGVLVPMLTAHAAADPFYAQAFPDLQGQDHDFTQFLGKPVVLNFWATWCPPCVKEMPDLDALHTAHKDVQFVGLAVDTESNVRKFGEKVQVGYPLLVAGHGGIKLMRQLGNKQGGLPFTVVFDAKGNVIKRILGQIEPDELEQFIKGLAS